MVSIRKETTLQIARNPMSDKGQNERDMEILSRAIVAAMMRDPQVRSVVARMSAKEKLDASSFMVMTIKVKNLIDSIGSESERESEGKSGEPSLRKEAPSKSKSKSDRDEAKQRIINSIRARAIDEGRVLSREERRFRDYVARRFDENDWLSRNRLIF